MGHFCLSTQKAIGRCLSPQLTSIKDLCVGISEVLCQPKTDVQYVYFKAKGSKEINIEVFGKILAFKVPVGLLITSYQVKKLFVTLNFYNTNAQEDYIL